MIAPLFIVGCPRSGTTLLRDLLRSHWNVTFPGESHFIPEFYRAYGDPQTEEAAVRLAARILSFPWIQAWRLPLSTNDFRDCRRFRDILSRLYEAWATRENKRRWGDKTPAYVVEIPLLLSIFPEAKVLHVIRDGRDVAQSWVATTFLPRNLYVAAELWKEYVTAGRRAGCGLSPNTYLEVRYESLLQEPEETMRGVCRHIGEPFCEATLRPSRIPEQWQARFFVGRRRSAGHDRIVATNLARWKTRMSRSDRTLIESLAGDLLAELGYEVENRRRRISPSERLFWKTHHHFLHWSRIVSNVNNVAQTSARLKLRWAKLRRGSHLP